MVQGEAIAVADIGSTKITVAVGEKDSTGKIRIAGIASAPAEGFSGGAVQSPAIAEKTLDRLLTDIQLKTGRTVKSVSVALSSAGIHGRNSTGTVCISGRGGIVSGSDVAHAQKIASIFNVPAGKEIFNGVSQGYLIDDEKVGNHPEGRQGVKLTDRKHLIIGPSVLADGIVTAVNGCHCRVDELLSSSLAAAEGSLTKEEKELGTLFIDMGGDYTGFHIFNDGVPVFSDTIPYAASQITEDISRVLVTPFDEAERLKQEFGVCQTEEFSSEGKKTVLSVSGYEGYNSHRVEKTILDAIIGCRVEEIFETICEMVRKKGFFSDIIGGVVLSGGGALLTGIDTFAASFFDKPVRIGYPRECNSLEISYRSPAYSAIVGMLHHYGNSDRSLPQNENGYDRDSFAVAEESDREIISVPRAKERVARILEAFF